MNDDGSNIQPLATSSDAIYCPSLSPDKRRLLYEKNKQIVVRRFATIKEYLPCHLLFISNVKEKDEGAAQRLTNSLEKTKDQPLLLITDSEGLAEKGAVINFYLEGSNVKIEMNRDAEKRAGLTTSAQFLSIIERNGRFVKRAKEGN